jgi:fatty acid desaturase
MTSSASSTAETIRRLREALPPEAFAANRSRLWPMLLHGLIVFAGYAIIRRFPMSGPAMALVIGHSLACLGFAAHELSHNAIVRNRRAKYWLTLITFGFQCLPATMWNRLHNDAHHHHAGTPEDPDRPFLESERRPSTVAYAALMYPSARVGSNLLVFGHFIGYIARNVLSVFYPADKKPSIVTSKPAYRPRERRLIALELLAIAALQYGIWMASGRTWWNYTWASIVPLIVSSAVLMSYIFTNHFLNPITHTHDPIAGSTSVIVPKLFDVLHFNFSYHTEHHLFPSLNSDYYPLVSDLLKVEARGRYHQLPFGEAWRRLWLQDAFRRLTDDLGSKSRS